MDRVLEALAFLKQQDEAVLKAIKEELDRLGFYDSGGFKRIL